MTDDDWMRRCLELARMAEGRTAPNPIVGCVLVSPKGKLVAEGYHERAGLAHAERVALEKAGKSAKGCTAYVNLEPCKHLRNRRTSPCAPALLEAGIKRVVVGMPDPIRAHGGGARWLEERGVEVTRYVLEEECREANRAFVTWAKKGRPLFVLKVAATLDGKIATKTGESQWITGSKARADGRVLRSRLDAIMVGVQTVLSDDPRLTARGKGMRDPVRVVLDSTLRTPPTAKVLPANTRSKADVIIATTHKAPRARERRLTDAGAQVWRLKTSQGRPSLTSLAERLADFGLCSVLAEGGAGLHAGLLESGLCDELRLYLSPQAFGGEAPSWLGGDGVAKLADSYKLQWYGEPQRIGDDLLLIARRR